MRRAVTLLALLVVSAPARVMAQTTGRVEVFGGYAFLYDANNDTGFPLGWTAGAAIAVTGWLAATADVSGSRRTIDLLGSSIDLSAHAVMAGARASGRIGRLTESAQLVAGVVVSRGAAFGVVDTRNAFAVQPGVAVDYPIRERVAARAQLDIRLLRSGPEGNEAGHQYRVAAMVVCRIR